MDHIFTRNVEVMPHPSLIIGPPLIGLVLNWGLFGILIVQLYIYYICFPKDRGTHKVLVYGVFSLDFVQLIMLTEYEFNNIVHNWGSPAAFAAPGSTWFSIPVLSGIIAAAVQLTFSWRLWILAKSRVLTGAVALLAFVQLGSAIAAGVQFASINSFGQVSRTIIAEILWLSTSVAVDVLIALSMTIILLRSKTELKRGNALVNRLILLFVETGTLTASVAVVTLVTFLLLQDTLVYGCPATNISKIYSNTLLSIYNNRALLKRGHPFDTSTDDSALTFPMSLRLVPQTQDVDDPQAIRSTVHVDVFRDSRSAGHGGQDGGQGSQLQNKKIYVPDQV